MTRPIEQIVGNIGKGRSIPGIKAGEAHRVIYVSFVPPDNPADIFENIVWKVHPPAARYGGVSLTNVIAKTPDGILFYALEYHGDLVGWRSQIEHGASESGVFSGRIEDGRLVISDGRSFNLSDCDVTYVPQLSTP